MFSLSAKSRAKLQGVHPRLVECVELALSLSTQDFMVTDGVRTQEQQRALVAKGASKTLFSQHLKQADGFGHAVDLVPYQNGGPRWEWPLIYPVAAAMSEAAVRLNLGLRWGGVWDRTMPLPPMAERGLSAEDLKRAVEAYCHRHPGPDFLDGPHYELR